jgi:hypothetical protein
VVESFSEPRVSHTEQNTRGKQRFTLVRLLLRPELLLMRLELLLLFLELLLELGIDFLKMYILRLLVVKALPQGLEFLTVAGKGLQLLRLFPGAGDHTLHRKDKARLAT